MAKACARILWTPTRLELFLTFWYFLLLFCLATLAEWNVAVYGTKDSPDSRAAISLAPTAAPPTLLPTVAVQPPTPRVLEKEVSTRLQPPSTSAATVSAAGDWLDKSTIHQNNLEQQNNARASSLPNGGHLPEPVTVLSSSSSSGGARVGCRPGHWDSASAVCLSTCLALVTLLVSDDRLIPWTRLFR